MRSSIEILSIMLQCVAMCCSVLQCVAVCCSVLQCVAVFYIVRDSIKKVEFFNGNLINHIAHIDAGDVHSRHADLVRRLCSQTPKKIKN